MPTKIDQQRLSQFSHLEFLAKQVVEGFITGIHKSPFHGFSVEFAEHRPYNKGESTRHIDWKLYARTEKLFVKRYEEETNLRCQVLLDHSSSMYFPEKKKDEEGFNKMEFAIHAAAALMVLLRKQRDAAGLSVFSDQIELLTESKVNAQHHQFLFQQMEKLLEEKPGEEHRKTFAVDALHKIAEKLNQRSLVLLFSDMMDNSDQHEELFSALQHLKHNKHEVILFHTVDKARELELNYEDRPYTFVDLETNEQIKLNPNEIREAYTQEMSAFNKELKMRCGQYGIDFVECDISRGFDLILMEYLTKRAAMY